MSSIAKIALPLLAAAGSAYGQRNSCSVSATSTIQNGGDATAIAACETFTGNIVIATSVAEPIAINGVQVLKGHLISTNNSAIGSISADSLEEIQGELHLEENTALNVLNFPQLKTVQSVRWKGLPKLNNLGFGGPLTKADSVSIENTDLLTLDGLDLEEVDSMFIANNKLINSIVMQLEKVGGSLSIVDNSPDVEVSFPRLTNAKELIFRNCSSVELPSLESTNDSFIFVGNNFESFSAPNLTEVGGALSFVSNTELSNVTFPALETVGQNLELANNTKLQQIEGFPKLKTIEGALDFNGNISSIDMPAFEGVEGAFNIQSTNDISKPCSEVFDEIKDKGRIKGKYVCEGEVETPGGEGTDPQKSGNNEKKQGAASSMQVQGSVLLAGLAAFFLF
ncbi:hypothetical protein M011DRAFT_469306 [Sporormia fimetaria CBS 119925]|uniref:GPI-anchored cell wall organization protein Ecm33 n=1 Tax=Sporormia fimetaria CBS 119925 TaxID=1340428 RepID=A0A6A6V915_9PLEO|nr:hypothetical protein M011DRAFT_469306 [Sporormia fimetaria CBS 119925]